MSDITVTITNSTIDHSTVAGQINSHSGGQEERDELLRDIRDAQAQLADAAPPVADRLEALRKAVEKGDEKAKAEKVKELTSGVFADIVKTVAGAALCRLLGLG